MWYKVLIDHRRTYTLCVEDCFKVRVTKVATTVRSFVIVWADLICIEPVLSSNIFSDMNETRIIYFNTFLFFILIHNKIIKE